MKRFIPVLLAVLLCSTLFVACNSKDDTSEPSKASVDYSKYPFTGVSWTRDAENDIETIRFGADGSFTYYCSCGNPVNDSDLCDGYVYDDETKTVTLDCFETTDEMVTVIKVISCDDNELKLDFDGETRTFTKE